MEESENQEAFFRWIFTKKPNLSPLEAIKEFDKNVKANLLVSKKISVIKSKVFLKDSKKSFFIIYK